MLYEIEMSGRFFYTRSVNAHAAAEKVKAAFGGHFSHAFPTGRTKVSGLTDC